MNPAEPRPTSATLSVPQVPQVPPVPPVVRLVAGERAIEGLGGKGRSLAELVEAGQPVPDTGVVTTSAYREVAESGAVRELTERVLAGEVEDAAEIDAVFAGLEIDDDLERSITDLARNVGRGGPIAVRSSATVEDLHGSSFAGQYRSRLNVDSADPATVMEAVRSVWASLWHPAPTAYRDAFGIDQNDVAMAVVLMQMIPATTAGVVFTADPGGGVDDARVEAVEGLGEALVSGQQTPDAWVVPRDAPAGLPPVPATALTLALEIEQLTGVPQDVEWAAMGSDVYVVQARPITVLETDDGFDTAVDDHELTAAGIVEMVPGVLAPLVWEVNRYLLEEAFRSLLDGLGIIRGTRAEDRPFVRRVRGRAAIDFDQLRAAAQAIPGAVEELELQYFGTVASPDASPPSRRRGLFAEIVGDLRTLLVRRKVVEQADIVVRAVQELRDGPISVGDYDDEGLLSYARRTVDFGARALTAELGVAAAGAAAYGRLEQMLAAHLGPEDAAAAVRDVAVVGMLPERTREASAAVFAGPTWSDLEISPPSAAEPSSGRSRRTELEARLKSLPGWRRRRIVTGQFVDTRIHLIRRTIDEVVEQLGRREATKSAFLELGGHARRAHLEIGSRLVDRGLLSDPSDVDLMSSAEVTEALCQGVPVEVDVLGRRRNWLSRYEAEGQLPARFVGVPERVPTPLPEGDVLSGWAASPGRRRGRARLVRDAKGHIERGEVLVAEATDASWSPLFVEAGAVVVERGGPLSHAAILARELGLPAVLNVEGASEVLDGRMVSVDGDQGVVVIEDDGVGGSDG